MAEPKGPIKGFGVVTKDVAMDPTIGTTAKAVYLALATHRDAGTGECFPSRETLANGLGTSVATVKRSLVELEQHGVIKRVYRFKGNRQTTTQYELVDAVARRRNRGGVQE